MGGRAASLGILYDWLYGELDVPLPGDPGGRSYRAAMAQAIKDTIGGVSATPSGDMSASLCGTSNLTFTSSILGCTSPLTFENYIRNANPAQISIAPYYISGHAVLSNEESALALMAIAEENPDVLPLLETNYTHFLKGFIPARAQISVDGGHQTGFAYAYGNVSIPEMLAIWRTGLDTGATPPFAGDWQNRLIYPYLYGLRPDGSFPARGDNFPAYITDPQPGNLALMAAAQGGDSIAYGFFLKSVRGARGNDQNRMLEELYFGPVQAAPTGLDALPLSRHFRVAGEVLMRDSWTFANATLLEFKSSSFSSENHQHLDQNSFSLHYKTPLLIDSGMYDNYGTPHWANYYTRTIAHNAITVFDPTEHFLRYGVENSNDGGQWYPSSATLYPTLEEIGPGATNHLDGVVNYEATASYTYTRGNASKA